MGGEGSRKESVRGLTQSGTAQGPEDLSPKPQRTKKAGAGTKTLSMSKGGLFLKSL